MKQHAQETKPTTFIDNNNHNHSNFNDNGNDSSNKNENNHKKEDQENQEEAEEEQDKDQELACKLYSCIFDSYANYIIPASVPLAINMQQGKSHSAYHSAMERVHTAGLQHARRKGLKRWVCFIGRLEAVGLMDQYRIVRRYINKTNLPIMIMMILKYHEEA